MDSPPDTPNPPRSPFDDEDADLVLRSSDDVDFWVYKIILAKASPVFRDMFTLPREAHAKRQVVTLTEDADTIERLLRILYPVEWPKFASYDEVRLVLAAAHKYMIPFVTSNLKDVLHRFIESKPLDVYATAYSHQAREVAVAAAKVLLENPHLAEPETPPPEFHTIPALALHAISVYRKRCSRVALEALRDWHWMIRRGHHRQVRVAKGISTIDSSKTWVWLLCAEKGDTPAIEINTVRAELRYTPPRWWWNYIDKLRQELASRPRGRLATEPSIIEASVTMAVSCPTCGPKALSDLHEFGKMIAERIDAAIARVCPFHRSVDVSNVNIRRSWAVMAQLAYLAR
ncbi:hypothetical protein ONZ51_g8318 [Trametes cubensis]|uniref:BTB domain-containing protein n=1 Tax=Trametes cubensis TaxID=1111947 RepID=A0AAD7TQY5_9APHY|nr:hypothetical protein ONZ51_g8318 [Trametes cubensis]